VTARNTEERWGAIVDDMVSRGAKGTDAEIEQVIAYLATIRHEKAERALVTYLHVFENMLLNPQTAVYSHEDVETLLDRVCAALARYGTARSWKSLVDHGLKTEPRLGLSMSRIVEAGRHYGYGLEAGSKPELLAAISKDLGPDSLITCNGYKDETFVRMALNALRMKKKVVLILEKVSELERILQIARERGVRPLLGMRAKLYARGSGKWA